MDRPGGRGRADLTEQVDRGADPEPESGEVAGESARPDGAAPVPDPGGTRRRVAETAALWRDWVPPGAPPLRTLVAVVAGVGLCLLRRPTAVTAPSLWAEDGTIFLHQALERGWRALNDSYAGYLHIAPRSIAMAASWLPFRWTPTVYALAAALVASACCAVVLSDRFRWLLPGWPARLVVFVGLIALPRVAELHATLTNVIWWCGIGLLLLLLADDPRTRVGKGLELAGVVVLVLSGANGVVLAPLVLLRLWRTRTLHGVLVAVAWWAAAGVQVWVLVHADRTLDGGDLPWPVTLVRWGVERVLGPFLFSAPYVDRPEHLISGFPIAAQVLLWSAAAVLLVVVVTGHRPTTSLLLAGAIGAEVLAGFVSLGPSARLLPERYTAIPAAALLIGVLAARPPHRVLRGAQAALLAWFLALRPLDFEIPARRNLPFDSAATCVERALEEVCIVPENPAVPPGAAPWQVGVRPETAR